MSKPQPRTYRHHLSRIPLESFEVRVKETDLLIRGERRLYDVARDLVLEARERIEAYLDLHPEFGESLVPVDEDPFAPGVVREMIAAGRKAGVGPMAAVAGAIAEFVGRGLLRETGEIIVENGGDIFARVDRAFTIGIFAGDSPLSGRVGLEVAAEETPLGICTSSGTIGHSRSLGRADAACVISGSTALADAAATALGNRVRHPRDIEPALGWSKTVDEIRGALVIIGENLGAWGAVRLVRV